MKKPFDHVMCRLQDQSEEDLRRAAAAPVALIAMGAIDGELSTVETNASARPADGAACWVLEARLLHHPAGLFAELVTASVTERAVAVFEERVAARPQALVRQLEAKWAQELGATADAIVRRSWPGMQAGNLSNQLRATLIDRGFAGPQLERQLIAAIPDAAQEVSLDAANAAAARLARVGADEVVKAVEEALRRGRPDQALVYAKVMQSYGTARLAETGDVEQAARDEADVHLARANASVARDAGAASPKPGPFRRFWDWLADERADDSSAAAERLALTEPLDAYASAMLRARLTGRLNTVFADLVRRAADALSRIQRESDVVHAIGPMAADHRRRVESDAEELKSRVAGIVTAADRDVVDQVVREVTPADDVLVERLLTTPTLELHERQQDVNVDDLYKVVISAARRVTDRLRSLDLDGVVRLLDEGAVDRLAGELVPRTALEFRSDEPRPAMKLRFAVPGGADGRLGFWLRRHMRGLAVVSDSPDGLLAFGVLSSAPHTVDSILAYSTTYREAREIARREERDARLVADRRLRNADDGVLANGRLWELLVRGIVCGRVAPSQEPPRHKTVGGTWYVVPEQERKRPSEVPTRELDTRFGRVENGGGKLGTSLPDMTSSMRIGARMRETLATAWEAFCQATSPDQRMQAVDEVEQHGLLPSHELLPTLRRLRDEAADELVRNERYAGPRRPGPVPFKPARGGAS